MYSRAKRAELLEAIDWILYAAFLQIFYMDHAIVQLVIRCISEVQFSTAQLLTSRTLAFLTAFLVVLNLTYMLGHVVVPLPVERGSGIILDFVGNEYHPTRIHVLVLDVLVTLTQLVYLIVSYDQAHRATTSVSDGDFDSDEDDDESEEGDLKTSYNADPYSKPIIVLRFQQTYRRILASRLNGAADQEQGLTARGRRNRARRAREGLSTARVDDIADEEDAIASRE